MSEENILDANLNDGLSLGSADLANLRTSAKWAKFLGIVGFVFTGLMIVISLVMMFAMGSLMSEIDELSGVGGVGGVAFGALYLVLAIPYFFLSLFLYRFGTRTSQGVRSSDMPSISMGFEQLSKFFSVSGILMAILIGFYVLIILLGGLGAMFI